MTNEELVIQIQQGGAGIELLWDRVQKFIRILADRYYKNGCAERPDIDREDLVQVGYFALNDAVKAYNPDNEYKFLTYLSAHCRNRFNEFAGIRSASQRTNPVRIAIRNAGSLYAPILSEDEELSLLDIIPDPHAYIEDKEQSLYYEQAHKAIEESMQCLPEADVIREEYWNGKTIQQIAEETNVQPEEIRRMKQKCIKKMRRAKVLQPYKEDIINYYFHIGINSFQRTGVSSVEHLVMQRISDE